jgi:hypothetical protein
MGGATGEIMLSNTQIYACQAWTLDGAVACAIDLCNVGLGEL